MATNRNIIAQLQQEILPLQGFRPPAAGAVAMGLGALEDAFPNGCFPASNLHEFISESPEGTAASSGFITALLFALMQLGGVTIWIGASRKLFPPALINFGVAPDRIIFVDLKREKDALWAMEEALKCEGLAAVIGEVKEIDFTASRRFQLAIEKSRVTAFVLRDRPRNLNTIASIARWLVMPAAGIVEDGLPGVGYPQWNIELLKIRNGRPGTWRLGWSAGQFITAPADKVIVMPELLHERKVYA